MRLYLYNDKNLIYDTDTGKLDCFCRPCLNCPLRNMAVAKDIITEDKTIDCKRAGIITAFAMLEHNIKELIKLLWLNSIVIYVRKI